MPKNDGGYVYAGSNTSMLQKGMTRRNWLAGLAMQGILSSPEGKFSWRESTSIVQRAYGIADEMIAEGEKE